ncbi:MAG: gliding motility protein GldD, partial [Odoribacter sp.]|nr:gliding motility protein GldD [Odoribacter sp.]
MLIRIIICFLLFLFWGCKEKYPPKPYGYYRIDFPEKSWSPVNEDLPYQFDMASTAILEPDTDKEAEPGWINICYPQY